MPARRTSTGLLALAVTGGCDLRGAPSSLAELPDPVLTLRERWGDRRPDDVLAVEISFAGDACADLGDDLEGTANDLPLRVERRGGENDVDFGADTCWPITLAASVSAIGTGQAVFEIRDHSAVVRAEFAELFAERRLVLTDPADGILHVGDRARLRRSQPSDRIEVELISFTTDEHFWDGEDIAVQGDAIEFTAPRGWDDIDEGPGVLEVFSPEIVAPAASCEGADSCEAMLGPWRLPAVAASFVNRPR